MRSDNLGFSGLKFRICNDALDFEDFRGREEKLQETRLVFANIFDQDFGGWVLQALLALTTESREIREEINGVVWFKTCKLFP